LFTIGAGMAMLQVAINPLLRVAGGEEHFAFNSAFAQFVFGAASFVSPRIYSYMVKSLPTADVRGPLLRLIGRIPAAQLRWVFFLLIFAAISAVIVLLLAAIRFPRIEKKEDELTGTVGTYFQML